MAVIVARGRAGLLPDVVSKWLDIVWHLPKLSTGFMLLIILAGIFANQVAPADPTAQNLRAVYAPPAWLQGGSATNILGTDAVGRDVLSRLIHGARISLTVGLVAVLVTAAIGTIIGLVAGYLGGRTDNAISAIIDVWLAIPGFLFLLLLAMVLGRSLVGIIIALSILSWPRYARIMRSQVFSLKERGFVAQAKVSGSSPFRIMRVHILPNIVNSVIVLGTFDVGRFIITEASLSFLGLGVPPPTPAWGLMIADGRAALRVAWWTAAMPAVALAGTVLAANAFGDWLRDRLDPMMVR